MPTPQFFKNDATELKFYNSGAPAIENLEVGKNELFDDAYACNVLGEILYDSDRAPLANAIPRQIFRESFATIFDQFVQAGSFESYLTVFRNIFGDDVEVTFTVPAPGKLNIAIVSSGLALYDFIARTVSGGVFVLDNIIDDEGDQIIFQGVKGFETQYELEQMLHEMVPAGIFTNITLTVGGL